jgi:hypothetical protein
MTLDGTKALEQLEASSIVSDCDLKTLSIILLVINPRMLLRIEIPTDL